MKILIAEDDAKSRTLLVDLLKKGGYQVIATKDGAEAWQAMQKPDAPQLAILDWTMPKMSGLEVVRQIRSTQTIRPPYLILLSAKGRRGDMACGLDAGADDLLGKPFEAAELHARIALGQRIVKLQDQLLESQKALACQTSHDAHTGISNRRAILDRLRRELARSERHGNVLCVGICDIDHFRRINDTHGHQTGDDILCGLAGILVEELREYDSVGRMGGEEFLLLIPLQEGVEPFRVFDRICSAVASSRLATRSGTLSVTISIGVASGSAGTDANEVLEAADTALHKAKALGRNQVVLAPTGK